jgi:NAD(P)-dependent dehydrogenase (short-subunit alcohol dehydrogenase family)
VEYLSKHGAKVVAFDVNPYPEPLPLQVTYQKCNVTIWSDIVQGFEETKKLHGRIDIVVANAGLNDKENLLKDDLEEPDWRVLNVNLKGTMMSTFTLLILKLIFSCQSSILLFPSQRTSRRSGRNDRLHHFLCPSSQGSIRLFRNQICCEIQ